MSKFLICCALTLMLPTVSQQLNAQITLPVSPNPVLIESTQNVTLENSNAGVQRLLLVNPEALTSVTSEYSWLRASVDGNYLVLDYDENANAGERACRVTLERTGYTSKVMTVLQPGDEFSEQLAALNPAIEYVKPSSATASSYNESPYRGIDLSYDDDLTTAYHSDYSGFNTEDESTWPTLEYFFDNSFNLGYFNYVPTGGNGNGRFGLVDIWTRCDGNDDYQYVGLFDFGQPSSTKTITLPEEFTTSLNAIKFRVRSGKHHAGGTNAFAACIEMQFVKRQVQSVDTAVFADDVYSTLKPGVTLTDINAMQNPLLRELAMSLYTGEYDATGRVSSHAPLMTTGEVNGYIKGYGQYDQYQCAMGIMLGKGTHVIIVSGIPDSKGSMTLTVRGWKPTSDQSETYTVRNGINVITKSTDWNGLCYIGNYNSEADIKAGIAQTVTVHVVNGAVNGVLRPTLTNEQNQAILDNACHGVIDVIGSHVHGIWEVEAMKQYSKDRYVQYMNLMDQLIIWMHRLMGIEKYNMCFGNTTLAFCCNWTYMTQTGTGIAMGATSQSRLCNPVALMNTDSDAIWGFSHEWGHQHQIDPYLRWSGTWEVTNNICSIYNYLRMGYTDRVVSSRDNAVDVHLNDNHSVTTSSARQTAIDNATNGTALDWCTALKEFAAAQTATVARYADDKDHAVSIFETNIGHYMMMFYMLNDYFCEAQSEDYRPASDYIKDFDCDLYQSVRTTASTEGSTVEKDTIDKYELIAHAQNGGNAKYTRLKELYPESCWVTQGYLNGSNNKGQNLVPFVLNYVRKASILSGYNLVPYFERWGLLRSIAMYVGDYQSSYYLMPEDMLEEFRADMQKCTDRYGNPLKEVTDEFIEKISKAPIPQYEKPVIPNDHAISIDEVKTVCK